MGCLIHGEKCRCGAAVVEEAAQDLRIVPDETMCSDARIGAIVRRDLANAGGYWCRKDGGGVGFSFSENLLDAAGGVRRLLAEWEERR